MRKIKGFFKRILILPALIIGILLPINSVMAEDLNLAEESTSQTVGYSQLQGDTAKYTNPDTNYQVFIDDNYNLLTDQEEAELLETMKPLTAYGGVAFVSKYVEGSTAENYAREVAYKYFTGASPKGLRCSYHKFHQNGDAISLLVISNPKPWGSGTVSSARRVWRSRR